MNNSRPVYSSDTGRVTPPPPGGTDRKPGFVKQATPSKPGLPDDGIVRIQDLRVRNVYDVHHCFAVPTIRSHRGFDPLSDREPIDR